jgi:hypothetical protein
MERLTVEQAVEDKLEAKGHRQSPMIVVPHDPLEGRERQSLRKRSHKRDPSQKVSRRPPWGRLERV